MHTHTGNPMKEKKSNFQCCICGRYIAFKDFPNKVHTEFTPDTHFTVEKFAAYHKECWDNFTKQTVENRPSPLTTYELTQKSIEK